MDSSPEFLHAVRGEMIRRHLEETPVIGLDGLLCKASSFLRLASVLPNGTETGIQVPRGLGILPSILAHGRSGTGKTTFGYLLFHSLVNSLSQDVAYYRIKLGSLLNPNLGQTSRNVEDLFEFIGSREAANEIPFVHFDEVDAITISRTNGNEHDAIRRALSSFLSSMDRMVMTSSRKWVVYATTNIVQFVDSALIRRFHLQLDFDQEQWTAEQYCHLLGQLVFSKPTTKQKQSLSKAASMCTRKRLTPNDVRQLVLDTFVSQGAGDRNGKFPIALEKMLRSRHPTPSLNRTIRG